MATPSVLTVPSMYGDGILYSGPTVFGSELITNGTFDTDLTGWNTIVNVTWSANFGGSAFMDSSVAESQFRQNLTYQVGKTYEVSWEVKENNGCDFFRIYINNSYTNITNPYVGGHSLRFTHTVGSIFILRNGKIGSDITIDNVSVKEITQGSDFEFTRATTGTRINKDGYIEDVPYNFIKNSQEIIGGTGGWTIQGGVTVTRNYAVAPDGSMTADRVVGNGTSGVFQQVFNLDGVVARSVYLKSITGNVNVVLKDPTLTQTQKTLNLTESWQRYDLIEDNLSPTNTQGLWIDDIPSSGILMWGSQIVRGDKIKNYLPTTDKLNLPRLNYPTYGGCPTLLVEPQRTNLVSNSNSVANALSGNTLINLQINSSNNLSPENINNAEEIEVIATGQPRVESVATSNTTIYSVSCYVKKVTGDFFGLGFYQQDIGNQYAKFDLNTGTFIGVSSNGAFSQSATNIYNCEIIAHKNNWYRITCTILTGSAASKSGIKWLAMSSGTSSSSFSTGVLGEKFLIYGRQVEQADYTTSYIPTSGSTVTRNEDKALYAGLGTTDTFNDSEGVLFIETKALFNNNDGRGISINAGNGNNRILISYPSSASSAILGYTQSTAGSGSSMSAVGIDTTQKHKAAIKYKLNNTSFWVDGVRIGLDTSVAMPVGLKQLDFTNGISAAAAKYRGNLNAIAVYKTALTDTELANLTSYNNHDLFIPYKSRMQMISADQELQCTEHDITRFL